MESARIVLEDATERMRVRHVDHYLSDEEARALLEEIRRNDALRHESVTMFGKKRTVKRRSAAYATDASLTYSYAGKTMSAALPPTSLHRLMERVSRDLAQPFNFVLVQAYDDGNVGIGWHADDEPDIAPDSTIASISLGATRDFQLRRTGGDDTTIHTIPLANGSLLTMEGRTQRVTKHCVPPRARQRGLRVNLTLRQIVQRRRPDPRRVPPLQK